MAISSQDRYGVILAGFPGDTHFPTVWERAPESGGGPDEGSLVTIGILPPGEQIFVDELPAKNETWFYRAYHGQGGYDDGPATPWFGVQADKLPETLPLLPPAPLIDFDLFIDSTTGEVFIFVDGSPRVRSVRWAISTSGSFPAGESGTPVNTDDFGDADISTGTFVGPEDEVRATVTFYEGEDATGAVLGVLRRVRSYTVPVDSTPLLDEDDGDLLLFPNRSASADEVVYYVDSAKPTAQDVRDNGTGSSADEINVHTFTQDGERVWVGVLAYRDRGGGAEVEGPLRLRSYTYKNQGAVPFVTWRKVAPDGPDPAGKEAVELIAIDDSSVAALLWRVYDEGSPSGIFNRNPVTSYAADPIIQKVEITRPSDGGTAQILEFYAEDAVGNQSERHILRFDGDFIPNGGLAPSWDSEGGFGEVIPNTIDPDTGSWRFKVYVASSGDDTFQDPAFNDADSNEFSGNTFGAAVSLSAISRDPGEWYNVSGYFFRTANTDDSSQQNSIRSSPIRIRVRPEVLNNVPLWSTEDSDETDDTGTLDLKIGDPYLSITDVEFAVRTDSSGGFSAWSTSWDTDDSANIGVNNSLHFAETITKDEKHNVSIKFRIKFTDVQGNPDSVGGVVIFDPDLIPNVNIQSAGLNADQELVFSYGGDTDTESVFYEATTDGTAPSDPTVSGGSSSSNARSATVTDAGVTANAGDTVRVKVRGASDAVGVATDSDLAPTEAIVEIEFVVATIFNPNPSFETFEGFVEDDGFDEEYEIAFDVNGDVDSTFSVEWRGGAVGEENEQVSGSVSDPTSPTTDELDETSIGTGGGPTEDHWIEAELLNSTGQQVDYKKIRVTEDGVS